MPKDTTPKKKTRRNWTKPLDSNPVIPGRPSNADNYRYTPSNLQIPPPGFHIPMSPTLDASGSSQVTQFNNGSFNSLSTPSHPQHSLNQLPTPPYTTRDLPSTPGNAGVLLGAPIQLDTSPNFERTTQLYEQLNDMRDNIPGHPNRYVHPTLTKEEKERHEWDEFVEDMNELEQLLKRISESRLKSIGNFLDRLFWCPKKKGSRDSRSKFHLDVISRFLQGRDDINFLHIVTRVNNHRNSYPSHKSKFLTERTEAFSLTKLPTSFRYARLGLSAFAAQLCARRTYSEIGKLIENRPDIPDDEAPARLPPDSVTKEEIKGFSLERSVRTFRRHAPFISSLLEYTLTPKTRNGDIIKRVYRPPEMLLLTSMNPLIVGRNKLANGYLSMPLAVHQFATQAHIDTKRLASRMGLSVSDSTVRKALKSISKSDREQLQESNREHAARDEVGWCQVMDNIQEYCVENEGGLLRENKLKCGTAATAIKLKGCPPGAFDLDDHINRLIKNERSTLTAHELFMSIDWDHYHNVAALYWLQTLIDFVPALHGYQKEITARFQSAPIAIHRTDHLPETEIQPLGTNAERETETQGMARSIADFDQQMGYTQESSEKLLEWLGGDGATFAVILRLQKYLAPTALDNRATLRNKISTPEAWHIKDTALKAIAENVFGPQACKDPSSLSKLFSAINLSRPPNLKKCDHYPTSDGLRLVFLAQVLDCWRVELKTNDLVSYFETLQSQRKLPELGTLLHQASKLVRKYGTVEAYETALSSEGQKKASESMKIPTGLWDSPSVSNPSTEQQKELPQEPSGFDGDRTLANSILFKMQFGSWLLLEHAISEGDTGRVMQLLTVWVLLFAGSEHPNYVTFLLEFHCLMKYESSPELRTAILNNYLVKFGLRSKERDLMQEHSNRKLEFMVKKSGGNFDGPFYREIISPNVDSFTGVQSAFEDAFGLEHRKNSHTSPLFAPELRVLLDLLKDCQVHLFCAGRSYGHVVKDYLSVGYKNLDSGGKIKTFVKKTTARARFIAAIEAEKKRIQAQEADHDATMTDDAEQGRQALPPPTDNSDSMSQHDSESESGPGSDSSEESSDDEGSSTDTGSELSAAGQNPDELGREESESEEEELEDMDGVHTDEGDWSGSEGDS
ncbi:hypothetical protein VNI00_017278 [Paramarasmius palmivorus]|uniref:DUF6589 domain-containing protein n=1 Tax=Paramarasmius palmivorus TaxID=297713 RepID=A0AAW0B7X5_9AGAR